MRLPWWLGVLALAALCAAPAQTAQAGLRHEVLEAPAGPVEPEEPLPLRVRFEADCTSLLARVREPSASPGVLMDLALSVEDGVEVAGPEEVRIDAGPCVAQAASAVSVEVDFSLVVRAAVPAFAVRAVRIDAALEPTPADEAATVVALDVEAAPVPMLDVGTPQRQFLDDGRPVRPRLQFANLGNAELLVTLRPGPGLEPAPAPFRLPPGGREEAEFLHPVDAPVEEPRNLTVAWEAVVLRDGGPTQMAERGQVGFQVLPGRTGGTPSASTYVGLVLGAALLLAALAATVVALVRRARRRQP